MADSRPEVGRDSRVIENPMEEGLRIFEDLMSKGPYFMRFRVKYTFGIARLCNRIPEDILVRLIPLLAESLRDEYDAVTLASIHCLTCIACIGDGKLATEISKSGALVYMVRLLPWAVCDLDDDGASLRVLLKCLWALVSFADECRLVMESENGLRLTILLLRLNKAGTRLYLLEILSALSMLESVKNNIIWDGGLEYLIEAAGTGSMNSRERACQAIGLLGASKKLTYLLAKKGAIPVLVNLFHDGDSKTKFLAANALGLISTYTKNIRPAAQAGAIPLYAELLGGPDPVGRKIAMDVFCLLSVAESNALSIAEHMVRILKDGNKRAKLSASHVLWDIAAYKHSVPVFQNSGAFRILFQLVECNSFILREKVSRVISKLSSNKVDRPGLVDAGAIPLLTAMLDDVSDFVCSSAAKALRYFYDDPDYQDMVAEELDIADLQELENLVVADDDSVDSDDLESDMSEDVELMDDT